MKEDVVAEILLRLPVKCLIRYKCVCKKWRDLIEGCDFIEKHLSHNRCLIMGKKKKINPVFNQQEEKDKNINMMMNQELVGEILLRLPLKSLIRYKSVCKKWHQLIESPAFSKKRNRAFIIVKYSDDIKFLEDGMRWNDLKWHKVRGKNFLTLYDANNDQLLKQPSAVEVAELSELGIGILNSSAVEVAELSELGILNLASTHYNGIVCITDYQNSSPITLFNPTLRQFRTVPPPCGIDDDPYRCTTCHNCPCRHPARIFAVGIGFDDMIKHYKVVRMVNHPNSDGKNIQSDNIEAQVYDLTTSCWRKSNRPLHISIRNYPISPLCPLIFINGTFHCTFRNSATYTNNILTFNIAIELFHIMEFPHNWPEDYFNYNMDHGIFAMDESTLALVAFKIYLFNDVKPCCTPIDVWVMKEYGVRDSWMKLYSITSPHSTVGKPLTFWTKDKLLFITGDGLLICHNLLTGEEGHLRQYPFPEEQGDPFEIVVPMYVPCTLGAVICNESLVPINRI